VTRKVKPEAVRARVVGVHVEQDQVEVTRAGGKREFLPGMRRLSVEVAPMEHSAAAEDAWRQLVGHVVTLDPS